MNGGLFSAYVCVAGTCTVTLNGNYIALYTPTGYGAGAVSGSNAGNLVGINQNSTTAVTAITNGFTITAPQF
jgi:hypothetical protein